MSALAESQLAGGASDGGAASAAAASASKGSHTASPGASKVSVKARGQGKGKGVFKIIKSELQKVKQRWDTGVKLFWKRPPPPWPVKITQVVDTVTDCYSI